MLVTQLNVRYWPSLQPIRYYYLITNNLIADDNKEIQPGGGYFTLQLPSVGIEAKLLLVHLYIDQFSHTIKSRREENNLIDYSTIYYYILY